MNRRQILKCFGLLPIVGAIFPKDTILYADMALVKRTGQRFKVYCDGMLVGQCIMADARTGCCIHYARHPDGKFKMEGIPGTSGRRLVREKMRGRIVIERSA